MMSYVMGDSREGNDSLHNSSVSPEPEVSRQYRSFSQTGNPVLLPPFLLGESPAKQSVTGKSKPKVEGSPVTSPQESKKPKWPPIITQKDLIDNYNFEYSPYYPRKPWDYQPEKVSIDVAEASGCDKRSHWARLWVTVLGVPPSSLGQRRVLRMVEGACGGGKGSVCEIAGPFMGGRKMHLRMSSAELATKLLKYGDGLLEMPVDGPPIHVEPCSNQTILDRYEELGKAVTSDQKICGTSLLGESSSRCNTRMVELAVRQAQASYSVKPEVTPPKALQLSWQDELMYRYSI